MGDRIIIVDYGMGNLNSVRKKFIRLGVNVVISNHPSEILKAEKLILPGVGNFRKAINNLKELNLWDVLNETILVKNVPILGICLGMQLMAKHSEEGYENGFGWIDAHVKKFRIDDNLRFKVPHTGWNNVKLCKPSSLFIGIESANFYFVHSYHLVCKDPNDVLCETTYEVSFVSAIEKDNIIGFQFHPEKSHDAGEKLLSNFLQL
jgi:imidazole glycerol-phosphate synthase subunit HisH